MTDIKLDARVSNIVKFERETGLSLITAFNQDNISISTVVLLVQSLSGATIEQVDSFISEKGFEALSEKLMEALKEGGFLPKDTPATQSE